MKFFQLAISIITVGICSQDEGMEVYQDVKE